MNRRTFPFPAVSLLFGALLFFAGTVEGGGVRVPADRPAIGAAIAAAAAGDTILVAAGRFKESVEIRKSLVLLGGWTAGFEERDPRRYETVIDGGGAPRSVVRVQGTGGMKAILDGFTIENGWIDGNGGGVMAQGEVFVVLRGNVIRKNYARFHGGGACYFRGASGRVEGNLFEENGVVFHGGGLCLLSGASVEVVGNHFVENRVLFDSGGGLAALRKSHIEVRANRFERNKAMKRGGGVSFLHEVEATVDGNLFLYNDCGYEGAAVYSWKSGARIERNTLLCNYGPSGGAFGVEESGWAEIHRNLVARCAGPWLRHDGLAAIRSGGNVVFPESGVVAPADALPVEAPRFVDPLLCGAGSDPRLRRGSPCLGEDPVGSFSTGCKEEPGDGEPPLRWWDGR